MILGASAASAGLLALLSFWQRLQWQVEQFKCKSDDSGVDAPSSCSEYHLSSTVLLFHCLSQKVSFRPQCSPRQVLSFDFTFFYPEMANQELEQFFCFSVTPLPYNPSNSAVFRGTCSSCTVLPVPASPIIALICG